MFYTPRLQTRNVGVYTVHKMLHARVYLYAFTVGHVSSMQKLLGKASPLSSNCPSHQPSIIFQLHKCCTCSRSVCC